MDSPSHPGSKDLVKFAGSFLLLILGACTGYWALTQQDVSNPLKIVPSEKDLGVIQQGIEEFEIELVNQSPFPVEVLRVGKSCTCYDVQVPEAMILPKSSSSARVALNARGRAGPFRSALMFYYRVVRGERDAEDERQEMPELAATFVAFADVAKSDYELRDALVVEVGETGLEQSRNHFLQHLSVLDSDGIALEIVDVFSSVSGLSVHVASGGKAVALELDRQLVDSAGNFPKLYIDLFTTSPTKQIRIPIQLR